MWVKCRTFSVNLAVCLLTNRS